MARRRRSYGKGKDPVLVFVNNCIAEGQKRERLKRKHAQPMRSDELESRKGNERA